jgi:hypothetical protein
MNACNRFFCSSVKGTGTASLANFGFSLESGSSGTVNSCVTSNVAEIARDRQVRAVVGLPNKPTGVSALTPAPVFPSNVSLQRIRVSGHIEAAKIIVAPLAR